MAFLRTVLRRPGKGRYIGLEGFRNCPRCGVGLGLNRAGKYRQGHCPKEKDVLEPITGRFAVYPIDMAGNLRVETAKGARREG